ncbi:hypothetical protein SNE40_022686 [Patella caerulea]|uniref:Vesicular, overexpressed in cancer, prosurvival protein 1 n=1 Tax=Patella caerulea TaxID=87958 RepID=A0AAN8IW32_PATCE
MARYQATLYLPMTVVYGRLCTFGLYGNHRTFRCKESEKCCRDDCCETDAKVYTLWYFWVAIFLLLILLSGLSYTAWRRWLKSKKESRTSNNQSITTGIATAEYTQVSGIAPPPYKHSPPPYTRVDTVIPPPPYQEKNLMASLTHS